MSVSEDSDVNENPEPSSSFTSYQPPQIQRLAPGFTQSSDPRRPDLGAELFPDVDNDHNSDDSFLPPSNCSHDSDAEESRDQDSLDESLNPVATEESYYSRPNRHYGPASTWRSWTKDDRDVAESLELERDQNLSIHLYNAYALRSQAYRLQEASGRKRRRGTYETEIGEEDIFGVPKVWTAWPMPPNEVPRDPLDTAAFDNRPSKDLEECLISTTAKAARERWNAREWEEENFEQLTSSKEFHQRAFIEEFGQQPLTSTHPPDQADVPEMQMSTSQAFADDETPTNSLEDASSDSAYGLGQTAKPIPLADDDKVQRLLLPSTRHAISKFDHLLMALHRARQSYALPTLTTKDGRVTSSATDAEGQSSSSSRMRRRRSGTQRASSVSTIDTEASASTPSSRRRKGVWKEGSIPRSRKFEGLGLRDWSDVLGMAALTGWDEDVLIRASKRCADLFGENMLFRSFHETDHREEKSFFTERFASGDEPVESGEGDRDRIPQTQGTDKKEDSEVEDEADLRYPCPIESCQRHETAFHTAGNLKQHMAHNHAQFWTEEERDGMVGAAIHDRRHAFCPVHTCLRSREPFTNGSKLYLHVRKMHPHVNVEELKKLESQRRGEVRGKWTRKKRKRDPYDRG